MWPVRSCLSVLFIDFYNMCLAKSGWQERKSISVTKISSTKYWSASPLIDYPLKRSIGPKMKNGGRESSCLHYSTGIKKSWLLLKNLREHLRFLYLNAHLLVMVSIQVLQENIHFSCTESKQPSDEQYQTISFLNESPIFSRALWHQKITDRVNSHQ